MPRKPADSKTRASLASRPSRDQGDEVVGHVGAELEADDLGLAGAV